MIFDKSYMSNIVKKIIYFSITILLFFLSIKISIFYMPFLIALIFAVLLEPIIKLFMKVFKCNRKISSLIVIIVSILIVLSLIVFGTITLFNEANQMLSDKENIFNKLQSSFNDILNNISFINKLPTELLSSLKNTQQSFITEFNQIITSILKNIKIWITQIPNLLLTFFFTLIALYTLCTDRLTLKKEMEYHLPDIWTKKIYTHFNKITQSLGKYLKAELTLIFISFLISLIGLTLLKLIGLDIKFPLLSALGICFVDALPILGSSAAMIPWAIIEAINGNIALSICLIILLIIMTLVRNLLEPKLVSSHIGINPFFTLIAMYTGYKIIGPIGLIIGPILLIIVKELYNPLLENGILKFLLERN